MKKFELSVIVPCYNEAGNIPLIINCFKQVITNRDIEVILVDNGSTDNSPQVFKKHLAELNDSRFKVHRVEVNQGYGYGIMQGLLTASSETLAWTHADMQTDPVDVIKALNLFKSFNNENLLVKGSRKNRKLAEAFFSWGMQQLSSFALGTALTEINAQPKLFSRKFFEEYIKEGAPDDFSLDLYLCYKAKKFGKIEEIPVYFNKRQHGEAKGGGGSIQNRIKLIRRTCKYIFELKTKLK